VIKTAKKLTDTEMTLIFSLTVLLHDLAEDIGDLRELVEDLGGDLVLVTQLSLNSLSPTMKLDRRVRIVIRGALMVDGATHVDRVWREGLLVVAHPAVAEGTVHGLSPGACLEAVGGAHGGHALWCRVVWDIRGLVNIL